MRYDDKRLSNLDTAAADDTTLYRFSLLIREKFLKTRTAHRRPVTAVDKASHYL